MRPSLRRLSSIIATSSRHVEALRAISPTLLDQDHEAFLQDWTARYDMQGNGLVVRPSTTKEVSSIISYCAMNKIPVIPQGGNSGLSGGSVGEAGSVVLSLSRMNQILDFDKDNGIVSVEAGCVLESLQQRADQDGFVVPIDMGSKGICQIGGNLATNAGGLNVVRYGPIGRYVLGLEVVLGDGRIVDMDRQLYKDNMGLKLPQLFIGSEGILGVITKASLHLPPKLLYSSVAMITLSSFSEIPGILTAAKSELNEILSAFEFIDARSMRLLGECNPDLLHGGLSQIQLREGDDSSGSGGISGAVLLLLEVSGSEEGVAERLQSFMMRHVDIVKNNVVMASNKSQEREIWAVRENVPISLMQLSREGGGRLYKYDLSLTMPQMEEVVSILKGRTAAEKPQSFPSLHIEVCNFGHCGDLNLHLNILARPTVTPGSQCADSDSKSVAAQLAVLQDVLDECIAQEVTARRGSLSAEHGVGQLKKKYMPLARSEEELSVMRAIKKVLDPAGIMNPTAVLPAASEKPM